MLFYMALAQGSVGQHSKVQKSRYKGDRAVGISVDEFVAWAQEGDERLSSLRWHCGLHMTRTQAKNSRSDEGSLPNIQDDARLNLCTLIVVALADLEPPHVRVLHTLVHDVPPVTSPHVRTESDAWHCAQLKEHLPSLADGVMPLMLHFFRNGMITEGISSEKDELSWVVTRVWHHLPELPR
jgi:hypothetical protein